jgi:hypothetical protein
MRTVNDSSQNDISFSLTLISYIFSKPVGALQWKAPIHAIRNKALVSRFPLGCYDQRT